MKQFIQSAEWCNSWWSEKCALCNNPCYDFWSTLLTSLLDHTIILFDARKLKIHYVDYPSLQISCNERDQFYPRDSLGRKTNQATAVDSNLATLGTNQSGLNTGVATFQGSRLEGVHCTNGIFVTNTTAVHIIVHTKKRILNDLKIIKQPSLYHNALLLHRIRKQLFPKSCYNYVV